MEQYLALIGDLKGSRQIADREQAQRDIRRALDEVSGLFPGLIVSRLTLTLGDEFQALLHPGAQVTRLLDELERRLAKYPFRLGLGYGGISTAIDPELSIGADGPCYWHAREAIGWVHDNSAGGRYRVAVRGFGPLRDELLDGLFQTTDALKHSWTALQRHTFDQLLAHGIYSDSFEQNVFARSIGISDSSLTKRLSAGDIKLYLRTRVLIGRAMEAWHHAAE
ncbi:MAG: hypothetical protein GX653_07255 [Clostridiales bacterium]|nr:hypothetical protein [Clostridiales bacterium]